MSCGQRPSDKSIDQEFPKKIGSKGILGAAFISFQIVSCLMSLVVLVLFHRSCYLHQIRDSYHVL